MDKHDGVSAIRIKNSYAVLIRPGRLAGAAWLLRPLG